MSMALALALPVQAAEPSVASSLQSPRPTFDFGVGYRGFTRSFGQDGGGITLPRFDGSAAGVAVEARVFPFSSSSSALGNLGLTGEGQFSLGLSASYKGALFAGSATTLRGSLALRLPFDASEVQLFAGVGYQGFQLATTAVEGATTLDDSSLGLLGPRAGLAYRVQLTSAFSVRAQAAFLFALSRGRLGERFLSSSAFGLDAGLAVALTVLPGVQLRVAGDWSRSFVTLTSILSATEQQFGASFLVAVAL
jgi:hypothetical protein